MPLLYHYTNRAGRDGIYSKRMIEAREPTDCSSDGPGVYFTEILPPPANTKEAILANNFGSRSSSLSGEATNKARYWFKFELEDLPPDTVKLTLDDRNIWKCPVDVPIKGGIQKTILYHYTDKKGRDGIVADGVIKATRPHRGEGLGGIMPIAVYFTETKPDSAKKDLLYNMFGTYDTSNKEFMEKTTYWFMFYQNDIPNVEKRPTLKGRNEWVCKQNVPLRSYSGPESFERVKEPVPAIRMSTLPGSEMHWNVCCDGCNEASAGITGFRYLCLECEEYNLCGNCAVTNDKHNEDYMLRMSKPISQDNVLELFKSMLSKISKYQKSMKKTVGVMYHKDISCKGCEATTSKGMKGYRYKCLECSNYDLCSTCETNEFHKEHVMLRIAKPTSEKLIKSITKVYKRQMMNK